MITNTAAAALTSIAGTAVDGYNLVIGVAISVAAISVVLGVIRWFGGRHSV